jgi:DNA-binding IclR family transcriptional regulator
MSSAENSASDAGSLKRGVVLLKLLATAGSRGLPLTELAKRAALPHPSVHRVLRQLSAERLVDHHPETRRYRLGPLAVELGLAGSTMHDIRDLCDPAMDSLAKSTEDTVYLVMRSGFEAVCAHRLEGSFPIRTLVLEVGSRRPLGVGAGGLAILSALGDDERGEIIERIGPSLAAFGFDVESLARACAQARATKAAMIRNRISLGVSAVGVHFCDAMGQPAGALSVAALTQRMTARRMSDIADQLRIAVASVEKRLRSVERGGWQTRES